MGTLTTLRENGRVFTAVLGTKMAFLKKDFWSRASSWLRAHKLSPNKIGADYQLQLNNEGLISQDTEPTGQAVDAPSARNNQVVVKTLPPVDKPQSLEKLQEGFNKLIEQLQGINEHLSRQATQSEDLMSRMDKLPKLLESFPGIVENQKQLTEELFEQLKATAAKDQQFIETIEKIPAETAKQTDALVDIDHQLAAAADTDVQMAENFNKFNQTLDKLNQNNLGQTDAICQMSKTFTTSDRYLKYILSKQRKSFMWVFMTAMGVCVLAILILTGIVIYLRQ